MKPDPEVEHGVVAPDGPLSPTTPTSPTLATGPPGGADAAFDPVGGDYWLRSLKALTARMPRNLRDLREVSILRALVREEPCSLGNEL